MAKHFKFLSIVLAVSVISCSEDEANNVNQMLINRSTLNN